MEKFEEEDDDDTVCLGESFFINRNYELTTFTFGTNVLDLLCLRAASNPGGFQGLLYRRSVAGRPNHGGIRRRRPGGSRHCYPLRADYDLTGQIVWPGAVLMNNYLSENAEILEGRSVIELGSGIGITGILCSRFCREVLLTDHNDEVLQILKQNIDLHSSSANSNSPGLTAEKLQWGNADHLSEILLKHPKGFDLVLGADICFQQSSIPQLFTTVEKLLRLQEGNCKFVLAYVSRANMMDRIVLDEAIKHGMQVNEVPGTRSIISTYEGVIYEITLIGQTGANMEDK